MPWQKLSDRTQWFRCSAFSIVLICAIAAIAFFLDLNEPYLPFAVAGALAFFVRMRPSRMELGAAILFALGFMFLMHYPRGNDWVVRISSAFATAGVATFVVLALRAIWSTGDDQKQVLSLLGPCVVVVFFVFSAQHALNLANTINTLTFDIYLYAFDGSFGFQPSFFAGTLMGNHLLLHHAALLTYLSLPFAMAVVYAWDVPKETGRPSWRLIEMLMLAGLIGWVLYNIVPGTGPLFVYKDFPRSALPYASLHRLFLERITMPPDVPRNAVPSLHMAWVLLLWWSSRNLPKIARAGLVVYCLLTVLATMGTGQHYFVDLVVSVPFALFIWSLRYTRVSFKTPERITAMAAGAVLTLMWLMLIRFGVPFVLLSRAIPWVLVVLSTVGMFVLEARMNRSTADDSPAVEAVLPSTAVSASVS
jgi:uncharacterized SAM-binding protein YcdF (DUF218 family)